MIQYDLIKDSRVSLLTKDLAQQLKNEQGLNIVIPDIYTAIAEEAFAVQLDGNEAPVASKILSVVIPNSVISIGSDAFSGNQLMTVHIPESVTTIGDSAFRDNKLTSVVIPASITYIDEEVFEDNLLTSVEIGSNVVSIKGEAFQGNQLKSVFIPESVIHVDKDAFDFDSLETISVPSTAIFDTDTPLEGINIVSRNSSPASPISSESMKSSIGRLYTAAFGRKPDEAGLQFWTDVAKDPLVNYKDISQDFVNSPEFSAIAAPEASSDVFTSALYQNVLGRDPDPSGLGYWTSQLNSGAQDRADVLMGFANSPENIALYETLS